MRRIVAAAILSFALAAPAFAQTSQLAPGQVWGNPTGANRQAGPSNLSAILDQAFCSTNGQVLQRGVSVWACATIGGTVASVSNSDGTLTVSPTTGAVVASINPAHVNTWSATQNFATVNVTTGIQFSGAATAGRVLRGNGTNFVSAQLAAADLSNGVTGSGAVALATAPTFSGTVGGGVFNATTGFQVGGAASSGNVLRGNGTNFASAQLGAADLSNGVTGSGAVVLAASPTLTTPSLGAATATSINGIGFSGTASTTMTFPSSNGTIAALNIADQTLTGGANVSSLGLTPGNVTIDCGSRPLQSITNNGAFTITAPANDGSCMILVVNGASAGAITFSGFNVGANTGDAFTTTNGSRFTITVWRINGIASYLNKALQ